MVDLISKEVSNRYPNVKMLAEIQIKLVSNFSWYFNTLDMYFA